MTIRIAAGFLAILATGLIAAPVETPPEVGAHLLAAMPCPFVADSEPR